MPFAPKQEPEQQPAATAESVEALPENDTTPAKPDISKQRKMLWIVGAGIGLYMIGTGIWQAIFTGQP